MLKWGHVTAAAAGLALLSCCGRRERKEPAVPQSQSVQLSRILPESVHAYRVSITVTSDAPTSTIQVQGICCQILIVKPDPDTDYPILRVKCTPDN